MVREGTFTKIGALATVISVIIAISAWLSTTLIEDKKEPDDSSRISALQKIIRETKDYNERYSATVALGEIGIPAQTALLEALSHSEQSVRYTALRGLSKLPTSSVIISRIREVLKNDDEPLVRNAAVEALGKLNAIEAIEEIILALQIDEEVVRMEAAQVLGKFNTIKVKEALRFAALNDPEHRPRGYALESLFKLKDRRSIPIFMKLMTEDPDKFVRGVAEDAYYRSQNWTE